MTLAETIYEHSRRLPETAAYEVLAFIQTLEQRYSPPPSSDYTDAFLQAIAGGLSDDFPDDITDADLGIDAARDTFD
ncbi:DUF2281 domain-containing protein [Rhodopseudomonas palustris]|uniref:DUF2281 domain-containing protein n=1 Tax=Thiospirillum jenense TaxID=1653858 RepID=A0A839H4V6_9GAMM|nr:DUF2281 domain-containing protein [Thiospirillum jenense]MBB1089719.1 DUF2281 domain-containing protein [Rhodopseudomonas palustris]MBB1124821.1 DUF2281 domain-containing protein [Thiospirillum jenense]